MAAKQRRAAIEVAVHVLSDLRLRPLFRLQDGASEAEQAAHVRDLGMVVAEHLLNVAKLGRVDLRRYLGMLEEVA